MTLDGRCIHAPPLFVISLTKSAALARDMRKALEFRTAMEKELLLTAGMIVVLRFIVHEIGNKSGLSTAFHLIDGPH